MILASVDHEFAERGLALKEMIPTTWDHDFVLEGKHMISATRDHDFFPVGSLG